MTTYIVRRFAQSLAFGALASLLIFTVLVYVMPNGPYQTYKSVLPFQHNPDSRRFLKQITVAYPVDKPWPLSFLAWLYDPNDTTTIDPLTEQEVPKGVDIVIGGLHIRGDGALLGELGNSFYVFRGQPVRELIGSRWGNTVSLLGLAFFLSLVVAIPVGLIGAVSHNSKLDHSLTFFSFLGMSVPPFALGLILIIFLAVIPFQLRLSNGWEWLPYFPPGAVSSLGQEESLINRLYHLALPAITLALGQIAWMSRHVRFSMLDVLRRDYVRTARAKGVRGWRVISKHAFRNALIPLITIIGLSVPALATGAIVVEKLFGYPGLGYLLFFSLGGCTPTPGSETPCPPNSAFPDTPLALTLTLILIFVVTFVNMLADIFYAVADPRINYNTGQG
ncbi:MAG TPA: ABC transporter permease [Chloroflexia bacterium]|nr:ABC transporter permease [Chloroflexia bacterium]